MKRLITIALCCFLMLQVNVVSAQQQEVIQPSDTIQTQKMQNSGWQWSDHPGTFSITAGAPSLIAVLLTDGKRCYGAYSIRYEHNIKKWLAVGMRVQYEGWKQESIQTRQDVQEKKEYLRHHIDMTLGVHFTYVNQERVQVYSGVGLGISDYIEEGSSRISVAGYATPIGVRIGSKRVFGMAEVNVGTASLFTLGLCVKI